MDINSLHSRAREGNKTAEKQLFEFLSARYRLFIQRKVTDVADREELVQEALLTVAQKYEAVEVDRSFIGWAHTILTNKLLDYYKRKSRRSKRFVATADGGNPAGEVNPDMTLERRLLDCLHQLAAVNRRHARLLNLNYQGYTVEEICRRIGLTRSNLYTILSRARATLERCLKKGDDR